MKFVDFVNALVNRLESSGLNVELSYEEVNITSGMVVIDVPVSGTSVVSTKRAKIWRPELQITTYGESKLDVLNRLQIIQELIWTWNASVAIEKHCVNVFVNYWQKMYEGVTVWEFLFYEET